ncbi:triose-phosphate isomerase [Campylobacter geochelonis]|uniref:Triosephosphate isomerase n=1 Tax=Campylobacter geochelonis TaxID=1780362 RepID=A0A128EQU2_9BACT|nr:triose-phosphate isomerase [Campylobacter geochelonis]QKF71868.1 triosephosphate isomerase [Campylobacter geochelonis]CZE47045.1 triosephosphate isomerase [Campylobacter geochelonis]CZE47374.1 triosephosphate isomerase [Campylobacter geochelonis]CZE50974.1 triosephosphate isomerase [Campylobacter geochelonis]
MIYAANLKCNHTRQSFSYYAKALDEGISDEKVLVFPPASAFSKGEFKFTQGAQNFYPVKNGSYTGEIGKDMLDEFDIKTVLIGHSERRVLLGEDESLLKAKFDFAAREGWDIVYCIGESDVVHMNGSTKEFLASQLKNIDLSYKKLIIAYEPIWAIGTGKVANGEIIHEVLEHIATFTTAPLLYGGSVNEKNISEIAKIELCDGVLVGGASLVATEFLKLIEKAGRK